MRRIVMFNQITANGFFAGHDGNLDWVVADPDIYRAAAKSMPHADAMLFGRRTYEMFESAWRYTDGDDPAAVTDPHSGRRSSAARDQAVWINETAKVVFSRTLKEVTWKHSQLVHELNPEEIDAMKRQPGKDMLIFGSGSLVSQLTEHGLIDEYQFIVAPVVIGKGRSLLSDVAVSLRLTLLEARAFQSGNVMLRYVPSK